MLKYFLVVSLLWNIVQLRRLLSIGKMLDRTHVKLAGALSTLANALESNAKVIRQNSRDYQEFKCSEYWPHLTEQTASWFDQAAASLSVLAEALVFPAKEAK